MSRSPRLLVVNPNTSPRVTQLIETLVREEVGGVAEVRTVTASFGFRYIATRTAVAIAAHAVLDAVAGELSGGAPPDAILLGCFGDPGLEALTEMTGLPVIGFAEAGLLSAADKMKSFIVATNGTVWCEMLGELVQRLGLEGQVKGIHSIEAVADDPVAIARFLNDLARQADAEAIVLGGAGLIPTLPQVIAASALPIVDPHREAIRKAVRLATASTAGRPAALTGQDTIGLSAPLTRALEGNPPMPLRQSK